MKLKDLANIKTNDSAADFWVIRRGSLEAVGEPVRDFSQYHIGVTVTRTDILLPDYLYYAMKYLHTKGYYKALARGTLQLQHITVDDIKHIKIG